MRKFLTVIAAAVLAVILGACDPAEQGAPIESGEYSTPETTIGDTDGPLNDRERERLDSWNGTGDRPFGDDPSNDGRFSDVTCEDTGTAAYGYSGGVACSYAADGSPATEGITYNGGFWYWADTPISASGQCPSDDSCAVAWSHEETRPVVVSTP